MWFLQRTEKNLNIKVSKNFRRQQFSKMTIILRYLIPPYIKTLKNMKYLVKQHSVGYLVYTSVWVYNNAYIARELSQTSFSFSSEYHHSGSVHLCITKLNF